MACSPHHCNSHNTGTSTCSNHRSSCSANNAPSWNALPGDTVYASNVEELRTRIRDEVTRWNLHSYHNTTVLEPDEPIVGDDIAASTFNNLEDMVHNLYGGLGYSESPGNLIDDDVWKLLIDRYNILRQDCICNGDCSCNAVCSCYGDCGCNYSDENLKYNIESI